MNCQPEIGQTVSLTDDETKRLSSISTAQEHDATFVRILLEFLYKDDINVLEHRSFTGRNRTAKKSQNNIDNSGGARSCQSDKFKAISPIKKNTIFSLFRERIERCSVSKNDKFNRLRTANITRLVGGGITNLRRSSQPPNEFRSLVRSSLSEQQ